MGVAALISWLVTAFIGLYLVAVWLIENDVSDRGAIRSRLPGQVIGGHVLLALGGLMVWVLYLLSDEDAVGWATLGILGGIAVLGLAMFTRWIPVHRAFVAAEFAFPAERAFPVAMVAGHGLLAFTTFTLVMLTVLGVRGS
jgi:manganese efflux pump family protein